MSRLCAYEHLLDLEKAAELLHACSQTRCIVCNTDETVNVKASLLEQFTHQ